MKLPAFALVLAVSACAAAPSAERPAAYSPDAAGIAIPGSPLRIDFGRAEAGVVAAVTRLEGRGPAETTTCPGGLRAVSWRGGLTLTFRDGAFLGWARIDEGTSAGLTCAA